MACRRGRQLSLTRMNNSISQRRGDMKDHKDRPAPNNVDQLTFKYMEMCKVESSTDSDSEISPRWSDTSTLGCMSSASERGALRRPLSMTHKSAGRHICFSSFLDPYDGSSEDSDGSGIDVRVSSRQMRQQGKSGGGGGRGGGGGCCCFSNRRRRLAFHHPICATFREKLKHGIYKDVNDVQMKYGSDCELYTLPSHNDGDGRRIIPEEKVTDSTTHIQTMDVELQLHESNLRGTRSCTAHTHELQTQAESSCNLRSLCKRKVGFPEADALLLGPRKKRCVVSMEGEEEGKETA